MISPKNETSGLIKACKKLKEKFPNNHFDFYRMLIATEVLRHLVDNDWVNQTLFKQHDKLEKKNKKAYSFFESEETGFTWQTRIYYLSERLYNIRKVKNFNLLIEQIISGNLVSRYAEIDVGSHLFKRGIEFEFKKPIGTKTNDYDLRITDNIIVNCEIKHKLESTKLSTQTIKNSLSDANKQLPKNELGIIFLKIPQEWVESNEIIESISRVINPFFDRNKSNIISTI